MAKKKLDDEVVDQGDYPQIVDAYRGGIHNWTRQNSKVEGLGQLRRGTATASVGDKVHLNITPLLDSVPYPGGDELIRGWTRENGVSPCVQYRTFFDGREVTDTEEAARCIEYGSYEDDGGCTPAIKHKAPIGPGRVLVEIQPYNVAKYNGGVAVDGPRIAYYAD